MENNWTILKKKTLHDGFFNLTDYKVRFKSVSGEVVEKIFEETDRGDAAAILMKEKESGKFILTRQFRFSSRSTGDEYMLEIPAGMIEKDESPEEAIKRETLEETGYKIESLKSLGNYYLSPGGSTERIFLFYTEISKKNRIVRGGGNDEEKEDIKLCCLGLDQLLEKIGNRQLKDAKTVLAFIYYLAFIKSETKQ